MQTILSRFLSAGLLPIGEDDEKLKLLELAASELANKIKATPLLIQRFVLVGLDDKVPGSDPVHKLAEQAVFDKWQTITNKIGASPVQVYRAVILRAIEIAAAENAHLALAVTLIASSRPGVISEGKEQGAIAPMLAGFSEASVNAFTKVWVNAVDLSLPKLPAKLKKHPASKDDLSLGLSRAVGPTDKDARAVTNPNPHWPNSGETWAKEFVGRATDAIYSAIQSGSKGFAEDMQEALHDALHGLAEGIGRMAIRDAKSELLWIRTSLYSPSKGCSYRGLSPNDLLLYATLDISRAVNGAAPPSVSFFLREMVSELHKKKARLSAVLVAIGPELAVLPEIQALATAPLDANGRRGLLEYAIRTKSGESFEEQTGFKEAYEEELPDLAVRLYREMQILKLLSVPA